METLTGDYWKYQGLGPKYNPEKLTKDYVDAAKELKSMLIGPNSTLLYSVRNGDDKATGIYNIIVAALSELTNTLMLSRDWQQGNFSGEQLKRLFNSTNDMIDLLMSIGERDLAQEIWESARQTMLNTIATNGYADVSTDYANKQNWLNLPEFPQSLPFGVGHALNRAADSIEYAANPQSAQMVLNAETQTTQNAAQAQGIVLDGYNYNQQTLLNLQESHIRQLDDLMMAAYKQPLTELLGVRNDGREAYISAKSGDLYLTQYFPGEEHKKFAIRDVIPKGVALPEGKIDVIDGVKVLSSSRNTE
jgi:hypothetical protein